jgi:lipopolysaccharide transport system ATP-binding protein
MNDEVLVKVENVSKKFCRDLKRSLWYGVKDISSELFGAKKNGQLRTKEFWAVDDVSFELRRGECLGLIGHNGAGKSTLLKMLNGLIKPDKGRITMKGRIGALIELGAGFNPILTGRENIYNNGAVLGFSKKEIDAKFAAIVDFAEIGDFLDTPVQNYSSGMKVRLGFAVAAQMEPDVLIIDEVLAVGDVGFRIKCFNRLFELSKSVAIILVSHSMPQVARVASSLLLMSNAKTLFKSNDIANGIEKYFDQFDSESNSETGIGKAKLHKVTINSEVNDNQTVPIIDVYNDLVLEVEYSIDSSIEHYTIHIGLIDKESKLIAQTFSKTSGLYFKNANKVERIKIVIPQIPLTMGTYSINVNFMSYSDDDYQSEYLGHFRAVSKFKVKSKSALLQAPIQFKSIWQNLNNTKNI